MFCKNAYELITLGCGAFLAWLCGDRVCDPTCVREMTCLG